jgi:acyl-CoA synthetase (AMP-forming)/AMP-acid ligase II
MQWDSDRFTEYGLRPSAARKLIPNASQDVASLIDEPLRSKPHAEALAGRHTRLTFLQLEHAVNAAAAFLADLGVRSGDRVGASLANHPDIVIAFLATQRLGAIWVGINRQYAPPEKRYFIEDAGICVYLADATVAAELGNLLSELPGLRRIIRIDPGQASDWSEGLRRFAGAARPQVEIDPYAPAAIAYTSGTSGFPKGAVHSQHNIMVAATMAELMAGDRRAEVVRGTSSPLTILNIMIGGPIATLGRGLRQVCMDRIDILGVADWVKRERINTLTLVPTLLYDLLTRPDVDQQDLRSLTWVVVGSALVPEGLPALYQSRFGHSMTIGYGLTENPTAVTRSDARTAAIEGAIGRALPHLRVAILDEQCREVERGEPGEICVRAADSGPWQDVYTPTLGYWRRAGATASLLQHGWMHTGDVGMQDKAGQFYIHARRSDLIIRGGSNIYPAEIERVLRQDPRVRDCAVIGKPDPRLGESPVAFLQAIPDVAVGELTEDLKKLCAASIARYKVPVDWIVVEALPRNAMGKVVKHELKALLTKPADARG